MSARDRLRIGFIPLADATALLIAVDKGFTAAEGLDVELVREVSWSNVRDKLNIGLFDAAHLLSPVAIASSLGIGHVRVPIVAPFNLGSTAMPSRCRRGCSRRWPAPPTAISPIRWCRRARSPRSLPSARRAARNRSSSA